MDSFTKEHVFAILVSAPVAMLVWQKARASEIFLERLCGGNPAGEAGAAVDSPDPIRPIGQSCVWCFLFNPDSTPATRCDPFQMSWGREIRPTKWLREPKKIQQHNHTGYPNFYPGRIAGFAKPINKPSFPLLLGGGTTQSILIVNVCWKICWIHQCFLGWDNHSFGFKSHRNKGTPANREKKSHLDGKKKLVVPEVTERIHHGNSVQTSKGTNRLPPTPITPRKTTLEPSSRTCHPPRCEFQMTLQPWHCSSNPVGAGSTS